MSQRLRLPPYGPPTSAIGPGAVLQSASAVCGEPGSDYIVQEELTELATQLGLEDLRASLFGVKPTSMLRVRVEMEAATGSTWTVDGELQVQLQLSRDVNQPIWYTVAVSEPQLPVNLNVPGEPDTINDMRHTIRFEGDVLASAVMASIAGNDFTARVMLGTESEDLGINMLTGAVTVSIEELVPVGGQAGDELRRPSAGPYRALRLGGAVVQEATRRGAAGVQNIGAAEATVTMLAGVNPTLTPLRASSRLRVLTQIIVMTDDEAWILNEAVIVSLQLSDDAGGNWVEIGVLTANIPPSLNTNGEPNVANNTRNLLAYQADVAILDAFPAYEGGPIVARARISAPDQPDVADVVSEHGNLSATWLKLQELRA